MIISEEILSRLFDLLKNGDSRGISLYHSLPEAAEDSNFMMQLYHRAINEGFAEPGTIPVFGLDMPLRLSNAARGYSSHKDFILKNKEINTTVKNNTITINAPVSGSVLQESSFLSAQPTKVENEKPIQKTNKLSKKKDSISLNTILSLILVILEIIVVCVSFLK